jgi:hypothetical protein
VVVANIASVTAGLPLDPPTSRTAQCTSPFRTQGQSLTRLFAFASTLTHTAFCCHCSFWPVTVILDSNPAHIAREDKVSRFDGSSPTSCSTLIVQLCPFPSTQYASIRDTQASDTDSDPEAYLRSARSARGSSSRRPVPGINSSDSSSESDVPPVRRTASAGGYRSSGGNGRASRAMSQRAMDEYASGDNGLDDYGRAAAGSSSRQGLVRSASRARSSRG